MSPLDYVDESRFAALKHDSWAEEPEYQGGDMDRDPGNAGHPSAPCTGGCGRRMYASSPMCAECHHERAIDEAIDWERENGEDK